MGGSWITQTIFHARIRFGADAFDARDIALMAEGVFGASRHDIQGTTFADAGELHERVAVGVIEIDACGGLRRRRRGG